MQQRMIRRIWKTPGSKFNWIFLLGALIILGSVSLLYRSAVAAQGTGDPANDPFREFGMVAFALVLVVTAYTLRRRFVRRLPGKVQDWLWLHIWLGIISLFIAFLHENFLNITHDFSFMGTTFTDAAYGMSALYALILLVLTGIIGRLLDIWQARVIATEASTNGVGISRSLEERMFEFSLAVERLSAGKSAQFKAYCAQTLQAKGPLPAGLPALAQQEANDFRRAHEILGEYAKLAYSLQRQKRARFIIRLWRYIHIPVACLALVVIAYHSIFELWNTVVLHQ